MKYLVQTQPQGMISLVPSLITFVLIGLVFYFMIIKPQKKQRAEYQEKMENLKVGDNIVTRGGIRGKVIEIKDDSFIVQSGNSNIELLKQSLSYVENKSSETNQTISYDKYQPVGKLSYGNDERFIKKIEELKSNNMNDDYDLLLEDVYEYIVVENETAENSVASKFRLPDERVNKIFSQLEDLGVLSTKDLNGDRRILIDPR